jgi:hypothetical protein
MFDTGGMRTGSARNLAVASFETAGRADSAHRRAQLQVIADRVAPTAIAQEQTLPVLPVLARLFPDAALRRGTVVEVSGRGATSLALAVAAGPSSVGSWVAVVGNVDLGLQAVAELGVSLERLLVIRSESSGWGSTVAALIGAVDVVVTTADHRIPAGDARRVSARLRERGSVLIHLAAQSEHGRWPGGADVQLQVAADQWIGLGWGHGVLTARPTTVHGAGRGAAARPRSVDLYLPGPSGSATPASP